MRYFLLTVLLGVALASCQTKTTTAEDPTLPTDSPTTDNPADADINSAASVLLETIVGTQAGGVIRGIEFGDSVGEIRASETFEMFEDSLHHLGYTYETDQLETIDVLYYFTPTGRVVNRITVDVYLNSEEATQQLWNAAKKHFTARYGAPLQDMGRNVSWEKSPAQVSIKDVSEGKDYGLKMVFTPTDKAMLALY